MASARTLVPFLVTFFILLNITPSFSQNTQQLIEHICRQMEEFGFCSQTFKENLKAPNADIVDLTQITIERATDNATKTHDFIRQFLDNPTTDPGLKNALVACENAYRLLMESFDAAALSFFQKDYDSVERSESVTPRAEASCEDSLSSAVNKENLLTERNREMRILVAMALVSVHELMDAQKTN